MTTTVAAILSDLDLIRFSGITRAQNTVSAGRGSIDLQPAEEAVNRRDRQADYVRPGSFNPVDEPGAAALDRIRPSLAVGLARSHVPRNFRLAERQESDPRRHHL